MGEQAWNMQADHERTPGVRVCRDGVHFGYYASADTVPHLLLYRKGSIEAEADIPFPEPPLTGHFYSMKIQFPADRYEYNFLDGGKVVTDPYAQCIAGRESYGDIPSDDPNSLRGGFLTGSYRWGNDELPQIPYDECVMYLLHVRGFTMSQRSGVRARGTFAGLKKKIPYLLSLGVNQVRLMPVCEFEEVSRDVMPAYTPLTQEDAAAHALDPAEGEISLRRNYWGYGPAFYFAPKASYADGERADTEFKDLVRAMHGSGIEVILEFSFSEDTDIRMITDCLYFWAEEYHVDGFALVGRDTLSAALAQLPLFTERKLICSGCAPEELSHVSAAAREHLAVSGDGFQCDCRRMLKSDPGSLESFACRLRQHPSECAQVNYITNHDGFTLLDLVSYNIKYNDSNGQMGSDGTDYNLSWNCGEEGPTTKREVLKLRMRQRKNAFAMLLLSQSTPMILSGDEFGNTQMGNNNPWCHDSELTWLNWNRTAAGRELTRYVKDLIAYRKSHRVLHQKAEPQCADYHSVGFPDLSYHGDRAWYGDLRESSLHVGCLYAGSYAGEDGFVYIAWNFHWKEQTFALPILPKQYAWHKVMDTFLKDSFIPKMHQEPIADTRTYQVSPRTVVILEGRKDENTERKESDYPEKGMGAFKDDYGASDAGHAALL